MAEAARLNVLIQAKADQLESELSSVSKRLDRFGSRMQSVGRTLTTRVTLPLAAMGAVAVKAFADFETAMVGVAKTVDAPASEIERLGEGFQALSQEIPVSANELAKIGELAGQLGIETRNILAFTETIAAIGVATNLSTEQAAVSLARFSNVMGTTQADVDRLGATIVDLGNNLATTEAEITELGLRIAGAGKIAGLAESEVLAIAGALSSVGIQAEAGGTAVQKTLIQMNTAVAQGGDELETFARTAGVSATEFIKQWESKPVRAFQAFIEGLGRAGDDASTILESLFSRNQRLIRAFLALANANGLLNDAIDRSNRAWQDNTALTAEAAKFYDRLGADLETLRNTLVNIAAEIGEAMRPAIDAIISGAKSFLGVIRDLNPTVIRWGVAIAGVTAVIGPLLLVLSSLTRTLGIVALAASSTAGAAALGGLAALLAPAGGIALGAGAVGGAILFLKGVIDDIGKASREAAERYQEFLDTIDQTIATGDTNEQAKGLERVNRQIESLLANRRRTQTRLDQAVAGGLDSIASGARESLSILDDAITEAFRRRQELENAIEQGIALPPIRATFETGAVDQNLQKVVDEIRTDLAADLRSLDTQAQVLDLAPLEVARERVALVRNALVRLADEGLGPANSLIQSLAARVRGLTALADNLNESLALKNVNALVASGALGDAVAVGGGGALTRQDGNDLRDDLKHQLTLAERLAQSFESSFQQLGTGFVQAMARGVRDAGDLLETAFFSILGAVTGHIGGIIGGALGGAFDVQIPGRQNAVGAGSVGAPSLSAVAPTEPAGQARFQVAVNLSGANLFADPAAVARTPGAQVFIREGAIVARESGFD